VLPIVLLLSSLAAADEVSDLATRLAGESALEAADRLAELGPAAKDAVPQLIAALRAEDSELRWRAAWALSRMGREAAPAAPALVLAALREDGLPAAAACIALERMGGVATDAVLASMHNVPEGERARYLRLLGVVEKKPEPMVPVLLPFLSDAESDTYGYACHLLGSMGARAGPAAPILVRRIKNDPMSLCESRGTLLAIGEPCIAALRELAMDAAAAPAARANAIELLVEIGGAGVGAAKECIKGVHDEEMRDRILDSLWRAGPCAADLLPVIEPWIGNGDFAPAGAVRALLAMGPPGEPVLERILFTSPGENLPLLIVGLGRNPKGVKWLVRLAEPSGPLPDRLTALRALSRTPLDPDASKRALVWAEELLKTSPETACELAGSLGAVGAPLADRIRPLLKDASATTRSSAACALCRIGKGGATEALILAEALRYARTTRDHESVKTAVEQLADAGLAAAAHYELLLTALADKDLLVRADAATGLARMLPALRENASRVVDALQAPLVGCLIDLSAIDDVPALIEILSIDSVSGRVPDRLVALGTAAWEPLVKCLDAEDKSARVLAAQTLLRIDPARAEMRVWPIALRGFVGSALGDVLRLNALWALDALLPAP